MYIDQFPDMRIDNYLSVWVGHSTSEKALEKLLRTSYEVDIDGIAPWIEDAFEIVGYNEDFLDIAYSDSPLSPVELALRTSFGIQFQDLLYIDVKDVGLKDVNSLIVAGNLRYDGHIKFAKTNSTELTFVGSYQFKF